MALATAHGAQRQAAGVVVKGPEALSALVTDGGAAISVRRRRVSMRVQHVDKRGR